MQRKILAAIALMMLLMFGVFNMVGMVSAAIDRDDFPRLDDLYLKEASDEEHMISMATGGEVDTAMDIRDPDNVELLQGAPYNWKINAEPGYGIHITNVNCRPYYPDSAGEKVDYYGRGPGDSGFPLNVTELRFALKLLISGSQMATWVADVFDWTQVPLDTVITTAHGDWYNSEMTVYGYEPELALDVLNGAGWFNDTADAAAAAALPGHEHWVAHGGADGEWYNINPDIGPTVQLRQIRVVCCIEAVASTSAISIREFEAWDSFFGANSTGHHYFIDESLSWTFTELIYMTFWDRHYDLSSHGWSLGKNPDYAYDFFHPDVDVCYGDNGPGLTGFPEVEAKEFAVKFGRWPNGTFVTMEEMKDILWELQEDLYYLEPFMVTYQSVYANAFAPGLKCQIRSSGYGSDNWWTYNWMYWPDDLTKTSMNPVNPGPVTSLNPGYVSTVYDHEVTDRLMDGFWDVNLFTHADFPWAVCNLFEGSTPEFWSDEGLGVQYGQKITWRLRPGIYWHFGREFVASDAVFAYETMCNLSLAQYAMIVTTYIKAEIHDTYTFSIYMNATGPWIAYDYAGTAMFGFAPEVWAGWWGDPTGAEAWKPENDNFDDFTGQTGHGDLTCLVGTGPFIFVDRNEITGVSHVTANRPDAVWTGNPGYWAKDFLREDIDFNGVVEIYDAIYHFADYWAEPGDPNWNHGRCDIRHDYVIDIYDGIRIQNHYWYVTLPPCP